MVWAADAGCHLIFDVLVTSGESRHLIFGFTGFLLVITGYLICISENIVSLD
jgi:hypothetical protein